MGFVCVKSLFFASTSSEGPSALKGYTLSELSSAYGGVEQRWLLIESEQRRKSDLKQLAKKMELHQHQSQQDLRVLCAREFACSADAMSAAQTLSKKMT